MPATEDAQNVPAPTAHADASAPAVEGGRPTAPPADTEEPGPAEPMPRDEAEREVARWAAQHRNAFTSRRDFNLALCDRLAARGIAPLTGLLRRLGGRGTSSSQDDDVRSWYATIAARLGNLEAQIPMGARRQANLLIEQLWLAATNEVEERRAAPLRVELAHVQEQAATQAARIGELEQAVAAERQRTQALGDDLQAASERYRTDVERVQGEVEAARRALAEAVQRHASEADRLRAEVASAKEAHAAEVRELQRQHSLAQQTAADERSRLLRQVDEARQAARDWQARHDDQGRKREQLQERLEAALVAEARALAEQATSAAQARKLQQQLEEAQADLTATREALAAARVETAAAQERAALMQGQIDAVQRELQQAREAAANRKHSPQSAPKK